MELARGLVKPPKFSGNDMYLALSLLSGNIDLIQAQVYRNSLNILPRRDKVVFYDCTNYYFEIEDDDPDFIDKRTGEITAGLRKYGKSKEHRPNQIVQMGMFMDYDGILLAFKAFPGNESEQQSLRPLEEVLNRRFGMIDYVVSTDAGLGSEDNRRFNMARGREYITVQSIPQLPKADREMCTRPEGWRIAFRKNDIHREPLDTENPDRETFNLDRLLKEEKERPGMLKDTTLYKEIVVMKGPDGDKRPERVSSPMTVTSPCFSSISAPRTSGGAKRLVDKKQTKSRQSQQAPATMSPPCT